MNQATERPNPSDYHYSRHMGSYKLYRNNHDGTSTKVDQHWNEEVIRKKCYELNGWDYKPKKQYTNE